MTTTLRPTGPIQQGADGAKSRSYDVCDNGRPVGAVEIGTDPGFGAKAGVLRSLHIDESRRRRGRGTIAALAAEEVLRGWGCTQMTLSVMVDETAAQGLAAALGYAERSRNMLKELPSTPPELPDGVSARPMTDDEFAHWASDALRSYAQTWIDRGVPVDQAVRKAETSHAQFLPHGLASEGCIFTSSSTRTGSWAMSGWRGTKCTQGCWCRTCSTSRCVRSSAGGGTAGR